MTYIKNILLYMAFNLVFILISSVIINSFEFDELVYISSLLSIPSFIDSYLFSGMLGMAFVLVCPVIYILSIALYSSRRGCVLNLAFMVNIVILILSSVLSMTMIESGLLF